MKRYCFALDLVDEIELINAYDDWHQKVWPQIIESIKVSGIINLEIYRVGNRLFMLLEASDDFSLEHKAIADAKNDKVQKWETLMWNFQQALPFAKEGEKWVLMKKIFDLDMN